MKDRLTQVFAILLAVMFLAGCKKEESSKAPEIPPFETMVIDFGDLTNANKSATTSAEAETLPRANWTYSALSVGFWNVMIGTTFAVPVASFKAAFNQIPVIVDDGTWQWTYSFDGFTSQYTARLVGKLQTNQIKWEMYISKTGIDSFDEFLWFEGTSHTDGKSGQWILYHSPDYQEEVVQIDWEKTGDEVGEVKYTYVRELDNDGQPENYKDSYLIYGLQDQILDAFVTVHVFNGQSATFTDTSVEWSRTDYSGRVQAQQYFGDNDWHCWDSDGYDTICE